MMETQWPIKKIGNCDMWYKEPDQAGTAVEAYSGAGHEHGDRRAVAEEVESFSLRPSLLEARWTIR